MYLLQEPSAIVLVIAIGEDEVWICCCGSGDAGDGREVGSSSWKLKRSACLSLCVCAVFCRTVLCEVSEMLPCYHNNNGGGIGNSRVVRRGC